MQTQLLNDAMRVEFDTNDRRESEEAKTVYRQAIADGRVIASLADKTKQLRSFRDVIAEGGFIVAARELTETQFAVRLYNETGDTRIVWDSGRPKEVADAFKLFEEYTARGWRAYAIDPTGNKKHRIYGFDAKLEEVILDDKKTVRERLQDFVKSFKEVKMTPKTMPG